MIEWRSLTRITPPATEPISTTELYRHLRLVEDATEKAYADAVLAVAREWVENHTGTSCLTQTWELKLDEWWREDGIKIPLPPLQSITSVKYLDQDGVEQTLAASQYRVLTGAPIGELYWAYDVTAPEIRQIPACVTIRFVAGYTSAANVPNVIKQAILLLCGHWFEHRENVMIPANAFPPEVPFTVTALLNQQRSRWW